jgi:hypothetical protein
MMFNKLCSDFPISSWGRVDWSKINSKQRIENSSEIVPFLEDKIGISPDSEIYLLWNYSDAPSIIAKLTKTIAVIDDVTAVGSDTWLYDPDLGYVVEFFHEGEITTGLKVSKP